MSYLCATVHVAHAHRARGYRWADEPAAFEAMKKKVPQSVGACFALIERRMLRGPWVMGEAYTIADPYLFTLARWMEVDGVDPQRLPARARPSRPDGRAPRRPAGARERGTGVAWTPQAIFTYSKSPGWLLTPTRGGAIQLAYLPGS